ncbi:hypothetical protein KIN20_022672 [Parelaphostrongylus tenuis]|uniref:Uncharacterized protein n=1 Tax=Parelaphostrongylus tenuis TaxID=148309 RepID=A0AAD5MVT9_PARTN|nr:hypothetical protein KIN20_022672 [Parelaphostrongylus tenuis]
MTDSVTPRESSRCCGMLHVRTLAFTIAVFEIAFLLYQPINQDTEGRVKLIEKQSLKRPTLSTGGFADDFQCSDKQNWKILKELQPGRRRLISALIPISRKLPRFSLRILANFANLIATITFEL